jgi:phthalate 4,5-dioxygenase oxygenase subunit
MGPIVDRTREHLGVADVAIIRVRKRLLEAMADLDRAGAPAVDTPRAYRVKHGTFRTAETAAWPDELARLGGVGAS